MEGEDMGEVVAVHFLEKRCLMLQCAADCIYEELKTAVVLKMRKLRKQMKCLVMKLTQSMDKILSSLVF